MPLLPRQTLESGSPLREQREVAAANVGQRARARSVFNGPLGNGGRDDRRYLAFKRTPGLPSEATGLLCVPTVSAGLIRVGAGLSRDSKANHIAA
jgi:hypothetical protein